MYNLNQNGMNTQNTSNSPLEHQIMTPETVISSGIRFLNGIDYPERKAWVRGFFVPTTKTGESKVAFGQLTGKNKSAIRIYFAENEGNLNWYSVLAPNAEYDMYGTLSFYSYKGEVCIQLIPTQIVRAGSDYRKTVIEQAEEFNALKNLLYERRRCEHKSLYSLTLERLAYRKQVSVLLIRPKSSIAEEDIMANLGVARDFFSFNTAQGDFSNPVEIAGLLQAAQVAREDVIVFSRDGGTNLQVVDSMNVIEALAHLKKPLVSGLGHEQDNLMAELFADHICSTPTQVANLLKDIYIKARQELELRCPPVAEPIIKPAARPSEAKFSQYLKPEPTFYGIRWTDKPVVKWVIWFFCLLGVLQVVSFFW